MKIKKIINIIVNTITILLFVFTLILLIIGISSKTENKMPVFLGFTYSRVGSDSMEPNLNIGDIIITKDVDFADLKTDEDLGEIQKGDIIVFKRGDMNIVHRAIRTNEDGSLVTKGDKYSEDEEFVSEDIYIGKVILKIPKLGKLVEKQNLIFTIIIIIFIIIVINEIKNIIKHIIDARREKLEKEFNEKYNLNVLGDKFKENEDKDN